MHQVLEKSTESKDTFQFLITTLLFLISPSIGKNEENKKSSTYGIISEEEKNQSNGAAQIGFSFLKKKSKQDFKIHQCLDEGGKKAKQFSSMTF